MKKITAALIGAGQRGAGCMRITLCSIPEELQIAAVAEPDHEGREEVQRAPGIARKRVFTDCRDLPQEAGFFLLLFLLGRETTGSAGRGAP